ncbi:MAG: hypothetical protein CMK32_10020 [Porticoccaceae bacterium]|nr:hypothetical protein [Porticoccaceae bacterium]
MPAAGRAKVEISENGDTYDDSEEYLDCEFEGWYVIEIDGTVDTSTVIKPWISFGGTSTPNWKEIPDPDASSYTPFTFTATGVKTLMVPGNSKVKFVTTDYDSSTGTNARRTRAAK